MRSLKPHGDNMTQTRGTRLADHAHQQVSQTSSKCLPFRVDPQGQSRAGCALVGKERVQPRRLDPHGARRNGPIVEPLVERA